MEYSFENVTGKHAIFQLMLYENYLLQCGNVQFKLISFVANYISTSTIAPLLRNFQGYRDGTMARNCYEFSRFTEIGLGTKL